MNISAEPIAAAIGEGRDDKCEVVGQDSFAIADRLSLEHCRSCVRSYVAEATATLTS